MSRSQVRKRIQALLLALAVAAFVSQVLAISAMKAQPRYDEVSYMAVARSFQREGGVIGAIRCYTQGRCQEDNRNPAFELVLQPFISDAPRFYAVAKLVTMGTTLLLGLLGFLTTRRLFGPIAAVGTIVVWALMPSMGEVSSRILADPLFAAVILATVYAIAACQDRGAMAWFGTGALIGVAYLTKGNGHLLLPVLMCVGLHQHGLRLFRRPQPYVAVVGFFVVTSFLIWRNWVVFHSPFHNYNTRLLWLDNWEESWEFLRDPTASARGLAFFFTRHSVLDLVVRCFKGLGHALGVSIYSAGLGIVTLKHPEDPITAAVAVPRVLTGLAVLALGVWGLRRRRRIPASRPHALAVIYTLLWFIAAFALGQQGAGEIGVRYVLPLVVIISPYSVDFAIERVWPWLKARFAAALSDPRVFQPRAVAVVALATLLVGKVAWFAPRACARSPLSLAAIPAEWSATSQWFATHLAPGERFAFPYTSVYSTFDVPFPEPDQRWIYLYRLPPKVMLHQLDLGMPATIDASLVAPPGPINKVFVDLEDKLLSSYRDKLSTAHDAQGPLAFLNWPRCFASGGTPSRFLVYCRPTVPRLDARHGGAAAAAAGRVL